jgi:hypothetical protein
MLDCLIDEEIQELLVHRMDDDNVALLGLWRRRHVQLHEELRCANVPIPPDPASMPIEPALTAPRILGTVDIHLRELSLRAAGHAECLTRQQLPERVRWGLVVCVDGCTTVLLEAFRSRSRCMGGLG